jgi:hypothetical protein
MSAIVSNKVRTHIKYLFNSADIDQPNELGEVVSGIGLKPILKNGCRHINLLERLQIYGAPSLRHAHWAPNGRRFNRAAAMLRCQQGQSGLAKIDVRIDTPQTLLHTASGRPPDSRRRPIKVSFI